MEEQVILVDEKDNPVGTGEKMAVHRLGQLHRAFSIYLFDDQGKMLLQKRALGKYHAGGLWTNTCCSHPRIGETDEAAAHRRLREEFGFDFNPLQEISPFIYKVALDKGMTEHEYLHIFVGKGKVVPNANPEEIMDFKWVAVEELLKDIKEHPENYTGWFKIIMQNEEKLKEIIHGAS